MNRPGKKPSSTNLEDLMPESCFMDLQTYNSPKVADHIENKEAHQATVKSMLQAALKERIKESRRK
jgi:hypothetical protein